MMVDRTFHWLGVLFQISTTCTFCFYISFTTVVFLSPLFLLLTMKVHCLSKKKEPLSVSLPVYVGKWAGNLPLFVCWDQHSTDFFPTETQDEGVGVKDDH